MSELTIALAQTDSVVGDLAGNASRIIDWVRRAQERAAQVVVFPEMALTGYPVEDLALRESFQQASAAAGVQLAADLQAAGLGHMHVVVGSLGVAELGATNVALVLNEGKIVAQYAKQHLPNYGVFDEYRFFTPGLAPTIFEVAGHRLALGICEDLWRDAEAKALTDGEPVSALLVLNGSPFEQGKVAVRQQLAKDRAAHLKATVAYVNLVGGQDDLIFDGSSFVVSPDAEVLTQAPQFSEELVLFTLSAQGPKVTAPVSANPGLEPAGEIYQALVAGLRGYVEKNGFKSVLLGVSGGIDSALVAVIAADALGGERVHGISMPSRYSSEHSLSDAKDLMQRIGGHYRVVAIGDMVDSFEQPLGLTGVAAENVQARVRGVVLMGLSNQEGHLVLAPGNKSELAVGYSTIYGDAVGGYAPLKDVDKSMVWALSRWRNNLAVDSGEIPPIPENSITKPPSAELKPGQVDQDSLPPYPVLDAILYGYLEQRQDRNELVAAGFDSATVERVIALTDRAEWKRRQYPLGSKVTAMAFGRDRRLPVTNKWKDTPKEDR